MKKILILALTLSSIHALADENFQEMKTQMLGHFDKKIAQLQEGKACISAAKSKDDLRDCRAKMRNRHQEMRKDWENKRKEFKAKKEQKPKK